MKERQYARIFRKLSSAILQAILSLVLSSYRSVIAGSFHVYLLSFRSVSFLSTLFVCLLFSRVSRYQEEPPSGRQGPA